MKLADDGEILVRSPDLFEGYWEQPGRPRRPCSARCGLDAHRRCRRMAVDGSLRLIDRARDFLVTSGGKTISPSFIENLLRASPFIAEAIVLGHGAQIPDRAHRDRLRDGGRVGAEQRRGLPRLHQPGAARPRHRLIGRGRHRGYQRPARARRADQGLSDPAQDARSRAGRRAGDANAQGQARPDATSGSRTLVEDMYDDEEEKALAAATSRR